MEHIAWFDLDWLCCLYWNWHWPPPLFEPKNRMSLVLFLMADVTRMNHINWSKDFKLLVEPPTPCPMRLANPRMVCPGDWPGMAGKGLKGWNESNKFYMGIKSSKGDGQSAYHFLDFISSILVDQEAQSMQGTCKPFFTMIQSMVTVVNTTNPGQSRM